MPEGVIGARVRNLRQFRGWTQGQLAYKSQTTPAQISRIENNERPGVQAVTMARIAQALDTTVEYLMGQTGDPGRPPPEEFEDDYTEVVLRAKAEELVRRWRLVERFAPDQLDTLINIAYTQAALVLGAANAAERNEEAELTNNEEVIAGGD